MYCCGRNFVISEEFSVRSRGPGLYGALGTLFYQFTHAQRVRVAFRANLLLPFDEQKGIKNSFGEEGLYQADGGFKLRTIQTE